MHPTLSIERLRMRTAELEGQLQAADLRSPSALPGTVSPPGPEQQQPQNPADQPWSATSDQPSEQELRAERIRTMAEVIGAERAARYDAREAALVLRAKLSAKEQSADAI